MTNKIEELLQQGPVTINIGITDFAQSLEKQDAEVVQVDWAPPTGGDLELMKLLDQMS